MARKKKSEPKVLGPPKADLLDKTQADEVDQVTCLTYHNLQYPQSEQMRTQKTQASHRDSLTGTATRNSNTGTAPNETRVSV